MLILASSIFLASCSSYGQFSAGATGALVGSHIGRDIGHVVGGGRYYGGGSSALGSLIGAGVGAALGVGIQNSIERSRERRYEEHSRHQHGTEQTSRDEYRTNGGYQGAETSSVTISNSLIGIEPLTYTDANGDGYVSKGETIEVETYIENISKSTLKNVTISLVVPEDRYVSLSSPLQTTLQPGQKIRYTGRVYCTKTKKGKSFNVSVNVNAKGANVSTGNLLIYMK